MTGADADESAKQAIVRISICHSAERFLTVFIPSRQVRGKPRFGG
jgi:hypothetical protein